jgi:hypothetical protein
MPGGGPKLGLLGSGSPFRMGGFWSPTAPVAGQPTNLSINEQHVDLTLPLRVLKEGQGIWLGMAKFQRIELATSAILPESQIEIPNQLWNVSAGMMHIRQLKNGRSIGGMAMVGSPSDHPFEAGRDIAVTTMAFYNMPARNERDAWNFSVFYSPVAQIPFPIPGVAYVWRPNEYFQANLGIPLSMQYRPTETLTMTASYMPLATFNFLLRQQFDKDWSLYGGYQVVNNGYFLSERVDYNERFYVFDQRVGIGIDRKLGYGFVLDLSGAFLFDRQLFQATTFAGSRTDEVSIDPGVGVTLNLTWAR